MSKVGLHRRPLSFNVEQMQQINHILIWLADQTGSPLTMVADISGRRIHYRGRLPEAQSTGLAALAAGSFAANQEIGNFLGLPQGFHQQLLEGDLASLFILTVGPELLLVVAFTNKTSLGMVRIFAQEARKKLLILAQAATLAREKMTEEDEGILDEGFNQQLQAELDEMFAGSDFGLG